MTSTIRRGECHTYQMWLRAGQYARWTAEQRDIDIELGVSGAGGFELPPHNGSEYGKDAISVVTPAAGRYTIRVQASNTDSAAGVYTLAMTDLRPARPPDAQVVEAYRLFARARALDQEDTDRSRSMAIPLLVRAAELWQAAGDGLHQAQTLHYLGRMYGRSQAFEKSDQAYRTALAVWDASKDEAGRAVTRKAWMNLGGHLGENRADQAALEELLGTWRKVGDRRGEANLLGSLATLFRKSGDPDRAIEYDGQALELRRALSDKAAEASSLEDLAGDYCVLERYSEAADYASQALAINRAHGSPRNVAASISSLCEVFLRAGRFDEAIPPCAESIEMARFTGDLSAVLAALNRLGLSEAKLGRWESALGRFEEALKIEEELAARVQNPVWRTGLHGLSATRMYYTWALSSLHKLHPTKGYDQEAFLGLDFARGRYLGVQRRPSLGQLRNLLDEDTVLLEYCLPEGSGYGWLLGREEFLAFPIEAAVPPLARRAHDLLGSRAAAGGLEFQSIARQLSDALLGPVASRLKKRRLLIVPDDRIAFLPFGALPDPSQQGDSLLLFNHEIVYLPSAAALLAQRSSGAQAPPAPRLLALFSDPVLDARDPRFSMAGNDDLNSPASLAYRSPESLARLPHARRETRELARLAPGGIDPFIGFRATREAALSRSLRDFRLVHFSVHGFFNPDIPEQSSLVLSRFDPRGRRVDGDLRLKDISQLHLRADLVTLGACESGRGRPTYGYGPIGLAPAFVRAGARRVLATAWKVDDEAATELTIRFYQELLGPQRRSPAAALRDAQLSLAQSERWASPHYWAPFLLFGEWKGLQ